MPCDTKALHALKGIQLPLHAAAVNPPHLIPCDAAFGPHLEHPVVPAAPAPSVRLPARAAAPFPTAAEAAAIFPLLAPPRRLPRAQGLAGEGDGEQVPAQRVRALEGGGARVGRLGVAWTIGVCS